jgi:hypothetical protein
MQQYHKHYRSKETVAEYHHKEARRERHVFVKYLFIKKFKLKRYYFLLPATPTITGNLLLSRVSDIFPSLTLESTCTNYDFG